VLSGGDRVGMLARWGWCSNVEVVMLRQQQANGVTSVHRRGGGDCSHHCSASFEMRAKNG